MATNPGHRARPYLLQWVQLLVFVSIPACAMSSIADIGANPNAGAETPFLQEHVASASSAQAQLNVQMTEAIHRTHVQANNLRSSNTNKTYRSKQEKFKMWCLAKNFPEETRFAVTGPKLHLFLAEQVIGRSFKKRNRGGGSVNKVIGKSTVEAYTSAVVDLYTL